MKTPANGGGKPVPGLAVAGAISIAAVYGVILAILKWTPIDDALTIVLAVLSVFWLLERCSVSTRAIALHVVTQLLVVSWLIHLWTLGYEGRGLVFGGILPWSDAYGYYDGAVRLVHGLPMLFSASKRPLFSVELAGLLKLFGNDLHIALLVCALCSAWVISFATLELWKTHGYRAALFLYALLLISERMWAGFVLTENIGLPLGLVGFVLLWRAVSAKEADPAKAQTLTLAGLFALSLALMSRPGAFFVLPALALWGFIELFPGGTAQREKLRFAALAVSAIAAGVLLHEAVLYLVASGRTFGDYPWIVYGLIHHQDFTYIFDTHPYLKTLPPNESSAQAWTIVFKDAVSNPILVLGNLARSFAEFFVSREGLFGFVWRNPDDAILENAAALKRSVAEHGFLGPVLLWVRSLGFYSLLNAGSMFLLAIGFVIASIVGIVALFHKHADPFATLLRYALAGILLSAPYTPPWITPAHRVAIATFPFLAAVPATVLFGAPRRVHEVGSRALMFAPAVFAVVILSLAIGFRLLSASVPSCAARGPQIMELYPSTAVEVVEPRSLDLRKKAVGDLLYSIGFLKKHFLAFTQSLVPYLKPGTLYIAAFDACDRHTKILIDDRHVLDPTRPGWQALSARPLAEDDVMHVGE